MIKDEKLISDLVQNRYHTNVKYNNPKLIPA